MDFTDKAINALGEISKLSIEVQYPQDTFDVLMDIKGERFRGLAKKNAKSMTYGALVSALNEFEERLNVIIIADHLSKKVTEQLKENNTNYLDAGGNAFIQGKRTFILIEGRKSILNRKNNRGRLFQEAGLKLLLLIISNPEVLKESYRSLAKKTGISLGSLSVILKELENQNFLLRTDQKRILKNKEDLIERWVLGYNEVIRPRVFRIRMKAIGKESIIKRIRNNPELEVFIGGETGAQVLTHHLKPQNTVLYSNNDFHYLGKKLGLVPDEEGNFEIRTQFWSDDIKLPGENLAPKLVIYADLMGTNSNRNIETAQLILENGL